MEFKLLKRLLILTVFVPVILLSSCGRGRDEISYIFVESAGRVYQAAENVYTGTLLDYELYENGFGNYCATYKIKVQVKKVLKGKFKEGETVEDLCPLGFTDKNCDYMFMTGINKEYGFDFNCFNEAEEVYSGKVLEVKPSKTKLSDCNTYDVKVEIEKVYKGEYKVGETVENVIASRLEEIKDGDIFMTSKEKTYINKYRWEASSVVYNISGNGYGSVKLLENGNIVLAQRVGEITKVHPGVDDGLMPPKTYDELIERINAQKEINYMANPFIPT